MKTIKWKGIFDAFAKRQREQPHDRYTYLIIGSGLILISGRWWLGIVAAIFAKFSISIDVGKVEFSAQIIGFFLVPIALFYHWAMSFPRRRREPSQNDLAVVKKIFGVYDRELIHEIFDVDLFNGYITAEHHDYLVRFMKLLDAVEHRFNNKEVEACRESFVAALFGVCKFIGVNFFRRKNANNDRSYLYPDLNFELDGNYSEENQERYFEYLGELRGLIDRADKAMESLVLVIKKQELYSG